MFKKVDATRLDVCIAYACGAFLMYVVGGIAYNLGKQSGKQEVANKIHEIYTNGGSIEIQEKES